MAIRWLVRFRVPLLLVAVSAAIVGIVPARRLAFDHSIQNMFARDDPLLAPYRRLQRDFGGNEIVVLVYDDEDLLSPSSEAFDQIRNVSERCRSVPGVEDVLSLAQLEDSLDKTFSLPGSRLFGRSDVPMLVDRSSAIGSALRELFTSVTHGSDGRTAAVICWLSAREEDGEAIGREQTIDQLRTIAQSLPLGAIVGEPVMVTDGFRYVEADGRWLARGTMSLLALVLLLLFRSIRWMIIPLAVVAWAIIGMRAAMWAVGTELSMVSSMLTANVAVIAVATVMHVIVRFRVAREAAEPVSALRATLRLLVLPVTWACLTDAIGFASLLRSRVGPVHDFGFAMTLGAIAVLCGVFLLVPGLALTGRFDVDPRRTWGEQRLRRSLGRSVEATRRGAGWLALVTIAVVFLGFTGLGKLEVESDFTRNFRRESPIVEGYERVENRLGGAGAWDVVVGVPERIDRDYLNKVLELEARLRGIRVPSESGRAPVQLTKVLSLADVLQIADRHPILRLTPVSLRVARFAQQMPDLAGTFWRPPEGEEPGSLRIMLRAREQIPSHAKLQLIARVEQEVAAWSEETGIDRADVTGFYVLLAHLIDSMLRDQWICFVIAAAGIFLMMSVTFRSPVLAAVAMIPNSIPVLVLLGLMGHLGIRVNMGAAMIAAVSMGLSVDSSIHYVVFFQRHRRSGKTVDESLLATQETTGRALVLSTLALTIGFSTLCGSSFIPTVYFGSLVSLAMLGGLAGNLVILPLLMRLVSRRRS